MNLSTIEQTGAELIAAERQRQIEHRLDYIAPTRRGKSSEQDSTTTPLYVGRNGLTISPENQLQQFRENA